MDRGSGKETNRGSRGFIRQQVEAGIGIEAGLIAALNFQHMLADNL
jgi:hypothetical protein